MRDTRRPALVNGLGLLLCCSASLVLTACGGGESSGAPMPADQPVSLTDTPKHLTLPAHTEYGIYVNDADNSGYQLNCSGADADGTPIHMDYNPPPTVTTSDTETLDVVYNTGSGDITLACSVGGAKAVTRPVP